MKTRAALEKQSQQGWDEEGGWFLIDMEQADITYCLLTTNRKNIEYLYEYTNINCYLNYKYTYIFCAYEIGQRPIIVII